MADLTKLLSVIRCDSEGRFKSHNGRVSQLEDDLVSKSMVLWVRLPLRSLSKEPSTNDKGLSAGSVPAVDIKILVKILN